MKNLASLLAAGALALALAACGGGGGESGGELPAGGAGPADGNAGGGGGTSGGSSSAPGAGNGGTSHAGGAIMAALQSGSYLEFLATSTFVSRTPGSTSTSNDYGMFRLTLGAPAVVGGVSGYAVSVSGKTQAGGHEFKPPWAFLGLSGQRWVGSSDGTTLTTLYDPALPSSTTGFFIDVPNGRSVSAQAATFKGSYNQYDGIALNDASSDGGCQLVLSFLICSDTATSFSRREYLKDGIGPVGMTQRLGYSTGGSAPQVIDSSLTLELTGTSLSASDGTVVHPAPWRDVSPLPVARTGAFAAAIGDRIYLYGGNSDDAAFSPDRIDVYHIASDTWAQTLTAPRSLSGWRGVAVGNRVAMFSGSQGLLHDLAANSWTPTATLAGSGTLTGIATWTRADGTTDVVAVLDRGPAYVSVTLHRYNLATDAWSVIGDVDKGQRYEYETAMAGDHLYIIGGYANGKYLRSTFDIDLGSSPYATVRAQLSEGLTGVSTATLSDKVYVIGGHNFGDARRVVQLLDPTTGTVSAGPELLGGRYAAATAVAGGKVYVVGGAVSGQRSSTTVTVLSP